LFTRRFVARKALIDSRPGSLEHAARTRHTSHPDLRFQPPFYHSRGVFVPPVSYRCTDFALVEDSLRRNEQPACELRYAVLRAASTKVLVPPRWKVSANIAARFFLFRSTTRVARDDGLGDSIPEIRLLRGRASVRIVRKILDSFTEISHWGLSMVRVGDIATALRRFKPLFARRT